VILLGTSMSMKWTSHNSVAPLQFNKNKAIFCGHPSPRQNFPVLMGYLDHHITPQSTIQTASWSVYSFFCRAHNCDRLKPRLHDTTCCQTGLTTGIVSCIQTFNRLSNPFDNRFDKWAVSRIQPVVKPGCTTRLDEQWLFVQHGCQTGCIV